MEKKEKVFSFLLVLICIGIFVSYTMNNYIENEESNSVESLLGSEVNGTLSLSIKDNIILTKMIEDNYVNAIKEERYEDAYTYTNAEYRRYVSLENFIDMMSSESMKELYNEYQGVIIKKQCTENLYLAELGFENNATQEILLLFNDNKCYIIPENFLEYNEVNKTHNKNGIEYQLKSYRVNVDKCLFYVSLNNKNNTELNTLNAGILNEYGVLKKAKNGTIKIPANQQMDVVFEVESVLEFPDTFQITVSESQNAREITFELD